MSHRTRWVDRPSTRCKQAIAALPPRAFDSLEALLDEVQRRRERTLTVETAPAPQGSAPSGLWLHSTCRDRILVSAGVSATHHRHIVLHELGHMLLDHATECGSTQVHDAAGEGLFSTLSDDLVRFILRRQTYENTAETEAELFATMVGVRLLSSGDSGDDETANTLQRIVDSFRSR